MTQKTAFLAGVLRHCKEAQLDAEDFHVLSDLLLSPSAESSFLFGKDAAVMPAIEAARSRITSNQEYADWVRSLSPEGRKRFKEETEEEEWKKMKKERQLMSQQDIEETQGFVRTGTQQQQAEQLKSIGFLWGKAQEIAEQGDDAVAQARQLGPQNWDLLKGHGVTGIDEAKLKLFPSLPSMQMSGADLKGMQERAVLAQVTRANVRKQLNMLGIPGAETFYGAPTPGQPGMEQFRSEQYFRQQGFSPEAAKDHARALQAQALVAQRRLAVASAQAGRQLTGFQRVGGPGGVGFTKRISAPAAPAVTPTTALTAAPAAAPTPTATPAAPAAPVAAAPSGNLTPLSRQFMVPMRGPVIPTARGWMNLAPPGPAPTTAAPAPTGDITPGVARAGMRAADEDVRRRFAALAQRTPPTRDVDYDPRTGLMRTGAMSGQAPGGGRWTARGGTTEAVRQAGGLRALQIPGMTPPAAPPAPPTTSAAPAPSATPTPPTATPTAPVQPTAPALGRTPTALAGRAQWNRSNPLAQITTPPAAATSAPTTTPSAQVTPPATTPLQPTTPWPPSQYRITPPAYTPVSPTTMQPPMPKLNLGASTTTPATTRNKPKVPTMPKTSNAAARATEAPLPGWNDPYPIGA